MSDAFQVLFALADASTNNQVTQLTVTLDASKLTAWAKEISARGMRNAIRRAVDKSATAARRVALDVIAKDVGVPKARIRPGVTKLSVRGYGLDAGVPPLLHCISTTR